MKGISRGHVLIFTNQFAAMMRSQLPLVEVLRNLARETTSNRLRGILDEVASRVERGEDLGDVLDLWPKVFGPIYANVVKAGLLSGQLEECLDQIAIYLNKMDIIRRRLRQATTYPMLLMGATITVFLIMTLYIFPKFENIFRQLKTDLPALTRAMMEFSVWLQQHGLWVLGGMGVVLVASVAYVKTPSGRLQWDQFKLKLPMVGHLMRLAALASFARTFAIQARNEVSLLPSLELAALASNNQFINLELAVVREKIANGYGLGEAFDAHPVFEGVIQQVIASGDRMGNLEELLFSASEYFERMLDHEIDILTSLINPLLTVCLGLIITILMAAAFMPIMDMVSATSSMGGM